MGCLKRVLVVAGVAVLVLAIAIGGWLYWMTRHPWPQIDGTVQVTGLQAPVEIVRDAWGVPHIYAENSHDLFFAQGYAHAQDRFYQMEFSRRIGQGRLSEMLGETALTRQAPSELPQRVVMRRKRMSFADNDEYT